MIKYGPNKITATMKLIVTAEFYDDEATEETLRYCIEQDLEDAGFEVNVSMLKEREALIPRVMPLANVMEWMGEIDELRDPVYWENRREQYESQWMLEAKNPLYMIEAIKKGVARVWTWKPTEEQSKAVKWNE